MGLIEQLTEDKIIRILDSTRRSKDCSDQILAYVTVWFDGCNFIESYNSSVLSLLMNKQIVYEEVLFLFKAGQQIKSENNW